MAKKKKENPYKIKKKKVFDPQAWKDPKYDVDEDLVIADRTWRVTVERTQIYSTEEKPDQFLEIIWISYDPIDTYMMICSAKITPAQFNEYLDRVRLNLENNLHPHTGCREILKLLPMLDEAK